MSGIDEIRIPYTNHRKTPTLSVEIQPKDTSLVCFVFHDFSACGTKAAVVNTPARVPISSIYNTI